MATSVVVVGAMVDGKANFMAVAWCSPASLSPPSLLVVCNKAHHTNGGIRATRAFSVSTCTPAHIAAVDYVGCKSGRDVDKSAVFATTPGRVTGAPLIRDCALTMELTLVHTLDTGTHEIFIGAIQSVHGAPEVVGQGGKVDLLKLNPVLFSFAGVKPGYFTLGNMFATPWQVGATYRVPGAAEAKTDPVVVPFPHVDVDACTGCGTCVGACPHDLFSLDPQGGKARFKEEKLADCVRCSECVHNCSSAAISMKPE